ncbi:hypothetical protein SPRG_11336 [Saprolegnia parasitica CBS 223.65]|uniref:Uncharacterized protein n=1 Tax=Saprolegnia parasitica (strain CBS 223.65) TaxID=695850 RepID=A0A067BV27_SAPPC|nr:hypothetical protein SPRG_11336 [Saprolegnia parasitica CBS 223.65]KDO22384.1 hypothetical protein SPRG_11336 [Saprolegnia parasitica CBS 223.65]|eukprot:XP_012206907.1 hypothetical protein SPRG_11336 [Saprolegnia parasitica CBS 223.65]
MARPTPTTRPRPGPHPNIDQLASSTSSPALRTPRTQANDGCTPHGTIDLTVPEGTSLRSFRSVGTHPVSDDTLDSLEHFARFCLQSRGHQPETSDRIAGHSFILDGEAGNDIPELTVPSHSPYDDKYKYHITLFDSVPDRTAFLKWFALRTNALLTAYMPSRLDDLHNSKCRIVFRTKEVPAILRLTETTSLREVAGEDEKLGEEPGPNV